VRGGDGRRYRVIYPGRPGGGAGPDFRDAVLERDDGVRLHWDVEAHVRPGEWRAHGHGADRRYNGVIVHIALEDGAPVSTPSGLRLPLLVLDREHTAALPPSRQNPAPLAPAAPPPPAPAAASGLPLPFLDLAQAGEERFLNKSAGLAMLIAQLGPDQALWEAAVETLGYPANRKGFRALARRVDWRTAAALAAAMAADGLEEALLWAAGFAPRPPSAPALAGPRPEWDTRPGRPANHPRRRVPAAAAWAISWASRGGPAAVFTGVIEAAEQPRELATIFEARAAGAACVGRGRAMDAVVNVLLPGVHALAMRSGDAAVAMKALSLYRAHPRLQENSLTKEAAALLRPHGLDGARNACEQQGQLHIYRLMTQPVQPARQLPLV
jgi:hypothetical protein